MSWPRLLTTARRRSLIATLLLLSVLGVALTLRGWMLDFNLPYIHHPDEHRNLGNALRMVVRADPNPRFFHYPSLSLYLNSLALVPALYFGQLAEVVPNQIRLPIVRMLSVGNGITTVPLAFEVCRWVTVLFGCGTVWLTYATAMRLFRRASVGLLAAAWVALCPTSTELSRYITPDTVTTFFTVLALWSATRIPDLWRYRDSILAGAAAGLAVSCKYNAVVVVVTTATAHWIGRAKGGALPRLLVAALATIVAFLVTTPFSVLDSPRFLADMTHQADHYSEGHAGMEGNAPIFYLRWILASHGVVLLLALGTLIRGLWLRSAPILLLGSFVLVYYTFISLFAVRNDRTVLPLLPGVFMLAAGFAMNVYDVARSRWRASPVLLPCISALSVALLLAWPARAAIEHVRRVTTADNREAARAWIAEKLPRGSRIAVEAYGPYVDPRRFKVRGTFSLSDWSLRLLRKRFDYVIISEGSFKRFVEDPQRHPEQAAYYRKLRERFRLLKQFTAGGDDIAIYQSRH